jgi:signal transduction histidine kinase
MHPKIQRSSKFINWVYHASLSDVALWAILALVVVAIVLNSVASYHQRKHTLEIELQGNYESSLLAASMFTSRIQDIWLLEEAASTTLVTLNQQQAQAYLEHLLISQSPVARSIISFTWRTHPTTNIDATPIDAYATTRSYNELNVSQQMAQAKVTKRIHTGNTLALSDLAFSIDGLPSAMVARGVYEQDNLVGIIIAEIDITQLASFLYTVNDSYSQYQLYDASGKPAFIPSSSMLDCMSMPVPGTGNRQHMLRPKERGVYDRMCLVSVANANPLGWSVQMTSEEAVGASFDLVSYNMVNTLVATLALFLVMIGTRRNKLRIRTLQKAAMSISQGDLDARANLDGDDDLAEAAATFNNMAARIQQLEVSRIRFLQVAAHELRNPMAGLKGILSMWQRRLQQGREVTNVPQLIDVMEHETDRLSVLLDHLLEAFRVHEGQLSLNMQPVDLTEVLRLAAKPFQIYTHNLHLDMDLPTDNVYVKGDFLRLEEVFRNLICNAIKYSLDDVHINISLRVQGDFAEVCVSDNGIGIPTDQLDRVFDTFFRGTNLSKNDPGGLGLGLFICKDLVERHNGHIWVKSCEGQGSSFYVSLPLYRHKTGCN